MGTTYSVKCAIPGVSDVEIARAVDVELDRVNAEMSTYRPDSEISRFNALRSTDWFAVSAATASVVANALEVAAASGGAFDPTVLPLVELWGFGAAAREDLPPSPAALDGARRRVGWRKLEVRIDPPALRKNDPRVAVDLSAIAKGHGVDRVLERLAALGISDCFVEIGGEVRATGKRREGPWRVGIERPEAGRRALHAAFALEDAAIATSGNYRNFVTIDGVDYGHTIDPRSGRPVAHSLRSVSVIAPTCELADAWATALMVLGPDDARRVADERSIAALFLVDDGAGGLVERRSVSWSARVLGPANGAASGLGLYLAAFIVFALVVVAMAIGVIFSNRRIVGSCGGLAAWTDAAGNPLCDACAECPEKKRECELELARTKGAATGDG